MMKQAIGLTLSALVVGSTGCQKESQFVTSLYQKFKGVESQFGDYQATPGASAATFLQKTFRDQKYDVTGLLGALKASRDRNASLLDDEASLADSDKTVSEVDTGAATVLVAGQNAKVNYKKSERRPIDPNFFTLERSTSLLADDYSNDTVTWSKAESEFTVAVMAKMPVRDQGQRGTCASFAGVGALEAFLIKKYSLSGIDLSEQRFYFMSKPENWSSGGDRNKQGSDSGTGYAKSAGVSYNGATYPPGSPTNFNIPTETDCPYNSKLGSNDLQTPQAAGCETGVVKVTDSASWLYNYDKRLSTAQQIYDFLAKNDLPIVVGTRLSANWEVNDGLITLKDAAGTPGDTSHASGHAYMIVGARKLSESQYPGEGGMCFIIRNSWGRGWGVNGYSCMTLAWFNKWRFASPFPVVYSAELDATKFAEAKALLDKKPGVIADPVVKDPTTSGARRGTVSFFTDGGSGSYSASDFVVGALRTDTDELNKVLYIKGADVIIIRGILDGGASSTSDLTLKLKDTKIFLNHAAKGDVEVGSLDHDAHLITLCSQTYARVCELNYVESDKSLAIGLTKDEFEREEPSGAFDWNSFGIGNYKVQFSKPEGALSKLDVRFLNGEKETNPLRFALQPLNGDILFSGKSIGSLTDGKLCSGSFSSVCRIILSGDRFNVLFNGTDQ